MAYFSVKIQFSDKMAEFAFVKAECEAVDVKEECLEEDDPLMITSNSETGIAFVFGGEEYIIHILACPYISLSFSLILVEYIFLQITFHKAS